MILPKFGHIYIIDLDPRVGTKPGKQRPCLCVQPTIFCESGLKSAMMIPLTTNVIDQDVFPLRVRLKKGTCGLDKESDLLINQLLAWDVSLIKKDLGPVSEGLQQLVRLAMKDFLDL
ncbi:MAG: type II toxin-antitoxin system PemK/MazF family toxin [Pseudobdellovibrio sp.]